MGGRHLIVRSRTGGAEMRRPLSVVCELLVACYVFLSLPTSLGHAPQPIHPTLIFTCSPDPFLSEETFSPTTTPPLRLPHSARQRRRWGTSTRLWR